MSNDDSNENAGRRRLLVRTAVVASAALVASSCGARVAPYFPTAVAGGQGASQGPGGGSGGANPNGGLTGSNGTPTAGGSSGLSTTGGSGVGATGGASPVGGATGAAGSGNKTPTGGQSSAGSQQATGAATAATLSPSNFSYNPQQQAAYCTGTTGNTASAPGVTASTVTVGNVSGLTGAVSNTFNAGPQAVTALFNAINRFGGICGRQLKVQVQDDQQSSSANASDTQYLVPNVLAFVGSTSDADNGGVPAMQGAGVPDMGPAINVNRSNSSVYWSATGGSVTVKNGQAFIGDAWIQGLKQFHGAPKNIAVLSYNISISAQAGQEYAAVFQQEGIPVCYTNYSIPPAPGTVMGSVVQAMQQKGCDGVFTTMDIVGNADMLQDMQSDGYHPTLVSSTYEAYNPAQIQLAGQQASQGLDVFLASAALNDPVPGVQVYSQLMSTFEPGQPLSEFGLEAWADAELFVYALIKAGRNPTRQSLIAALQQVSGWSSDGAFGAYTPSARTGPPCVVNVQVKGSDFVRTWPPTGEYCNNHFVPVPG